MRQTQDAIVGELEQLGGLALTAGTERASLTWSVESMNTRPGRKFDKATGRSKPTGWIRANAELLVVVRDLALFDPVRQTLTEQNRVSIHGIGWGADDDNPAWRAVRADAIAAAITKGSDYAAALGGSVGSVEHIADVGLLSGDPSHFRIAPRPLYAASGGSGGAGAPSLNPVPQELHAAIEARLVAEIPALSPDAT